MGPLLACLSHKVSKVTESGSETLKFIFASDLQNRAEKVPREGKGHGWVCHPMLHIC